jgi:hypothetical protein
VIPAEPEKEREVGDALRNLIGREEQLGTVLQLGACEGRRVGVVDSRQPTHDLGECLVSSLLLVWQTAPAEDATTVRGDERGDLSAKARLADAGSPEQGDEVRSRVHHRLPPRGSDDFELALPAHERTDRRRELDGIRAGPDDEPRLNRFCFPPGAHRRPRFVVDDLPCRSERRVTDEDTASRCMRLEPRGRVHDVAQRERITRGELADPYHRLSGVDGRARGEPK